MPWGLEIMCWGLVLYSIIDIIIVIYFVRRVISVGYTAQATSILPTFVAALLMGGGFTWWYHCFLLHCYN